MEQLKVLVVDDDDAMRALLRLHLTNAGYAVTVAEDALVAGRKLLEAAPDLIILDVNLPYMSGLELAAILIADATIPHVPIIFISAHEGFAAQAEALGADFIVKPFLKPRLLESVARNIRPRAPGVLQRAVTLLGSERALARHLRVPMPPPAEQTATEEKNPDQR
jgi:DNA-binding response OmpR family regulator